MNFQSEENRKIGSIFNAKGSQGIIYQTSLYCVLNRLKNAVYGQISFGCCDVSPVILAHFPEFVVFVHSASQTFVILGEFC